MFKYIKSRFKALSPSDGLSSTISGLKQINRIILNTEGNQFTDNYIIVDKTISVSGVKMIDGSPTNPFVHTVYTLSGNMIVAKEENYAYLPQKEITYEYNSQLRPENFPFRVVNSFQPVGFDVISPLNLLYGLSLIHI